MIHGGFRGETVEGGEGGALPILGGYGGWDQLKLREKEEEKKAFQKFAAKNCVKTAELVQMGIFTGQRGKEKKTIPSSCHLATVGRRGLARTRRGLRKREKGELGKGEEGDFWVKAVCHLWTG